MLDSETVSWFPRVNFIEIAFLFFFFILACFVFCLWSVQVPMKNEIKNISTGLEETQ